jgi:hypothetical protein
VDLRGHDQQVELEQPRYHSLHHELAQLDFVLPFAGLATLGVPQQFAVFSESSPVEDQQ